MTLMAERQSARMSKITNDDLTRSGTRSILYSCIHVATVGVRGLTDREEEHVWSLPCWLKGHAAHLTKRWQLRRITASVVK